MHHLPRKKNAGRDRRRGVVMTLLAILLPSLLGLLGLIWDSGLMMAGYRNAQHVADGAAAAAAVDLLLDKNLDDVTATATHYVQMENKMPDAIVTVNCPPASGICSGRADYVEVIVENSYQSYLIHLIGGLDSTTCEVRAVAGLKESSAPAALVILDPDPEPINLSAIPLSLPDIHTTLAGLEVEGLGRLRVDGAILVNTEWGGVDEDGNAAGCDYGPPYGMMCTPLLPLTLIRARDIRVVGGVDHEYLYKAFNQDDESPLEANRMPVQDPYKDLPVPTLAADPGNVSATNYGGVRVAKLLPIPIVRLQPGVYDWIEIISGSVVFEPGVYVIRKRNPLTGAALSVVAGNVRAHGVMFYITDSSGYSVSTGMPDAGDGETPAPAPGLLSHTPSVLLAATLITGSFRPLDDPSSPFDGLLIYQRRRDRRPIVIANQTLLGLGEFSGRVYAKWGHVTMVSSGTYDASFAVGTMRFITVLETNLEPSDPFPPARDVFLVE